MLRGSKGRMMGEVSGVKFFANPFRVTTKIIDCPDHGAVLFKGIKDAMWKNATEKAMVVGVNQAVSTGCEAESFNIGAQAAGEVFAQSRFLRFIKPKAFIEIESCLVG